MSGARFFQVHKDGKNIKEQATYGTLLQARNELAEAPIGAEVVEVDIFDKVIARYSPHEPHEAKSGPGDRPKSAKTSKKWSRSERLTLWTVILALGAIAASFFVPEVRRKIGLEKTDSTRSQVQSETAQRQELPEEQGHAALPATPTPKASLEPKSRKVMQPAGRAPTTGNGGVAVGGLTQGPGSIAQIGGTGNTATIYNAPPDAVLTAHYATQTLQEVGKPVSFEAAILITTDSATPGPQLIIACDSPCTFQSMDVGVYAFLGTNRQVDEKTVEVGLSQQFTPNQTLRIVLRAAAQFHVVSITKM
jgi:hypothetical protein